MSEDLIYLRCINECEMGTTRHDYDIELMLNGGIYCQAHGERMIPTEKNEED